MDIEKLSIERLYEISSHVLENIVGQIADTATRRTKLRFMNARILMVFGDSEKPRSEVASMLCYKVEESRLKSQCIKCGKKHQGEWPQFSNDKLNGFGRYGTSPGTTGALNYYLACDECTGNGEKSYIKVECLGISETNEPVVAYQLSNMGGKELSPWDVHEFSQKVADRSGVSENSVEMIVTEQDDSMNELRLKFVAGLALRSVKEKRCINCGRKCYYNIPDESGLFGDGEWMFTETDNGKMIICRACGTSGHGIILSD